MIDNLLSWPVILAGVLFFFRRPLASLLQNISEWEGFGQKIKFGKALAEAEQKVDQAVEAAEAAGTPADVDKEMSKAASSPSHADDLWKQLADITATNPSLAIVGAWRTLEIAVQRFAEGLSDQTWARSGRNVQAAVTALHKAGLLPAEFVTAVSQLRQLRNAVAHGQHEPTSGEAAAFVEEVQELTTVIEVIAGRPRPTSSAADG